MLEKYIFEKGYTINENGMVFNNSGKRIGHLRHKANAPYEIIRFRINGKICTVYTHRLQAYKKFGEQIYNKGILVRHLDGNSLNNSWDNISIGTNSDNQMDIEKDKRIIRSSNSNKKYSDNMVFEICEYKKKHTYKETMKKYNINSKGTLHFILNNRLCLNNV